MLRSRIDHLVVTAPSHDIRAAAGAPGTPARLVATIRTPNGERELPAP